MEKRKKLSLVLCVVLVLALLVPQGAFAADGSYDLDENQKQGYTLDVWGGPEVASEGALRIYWGDFSSNERSYQISWKKADGTEWKTVEIEDPEKVVGKVKSYVITGLEPNRKYDIKISAMLKDQNGKTIYTTPVEMAGYTYVTKPEYEASSCIYNGKYLESTWNVYEKTSIVKFYRAESKDGEYKLVGQTDCRDTTDHANYRDSEKKVVFRDATAEPGKSYYYKAVNEMTLDDGTVVKAESPRSYNLTAKYKPQGSYETKLLNKKGTYAKTLTWKLDSGEANYKTKLLKKSIVMQSKSSTSGQWFSKKPVTVKYSYNGKTYYNMKDSLTIQPGKTVYLRISLKNKLWIRKDGQGELFTSIRYYYNDLNGDIPFTEHWMDMGLGANNVVEITHETSDGYEGPPTIDDEYLDELFKARHDHGYVHLNTAVTQQQTVLLSWRLCPFAEGYVIRYGTTEEEAKKSQPINVPSGQVAYELKDLEAGTKYYVILSEIAKDENGKLQEEERVFGPTEVTIPVGK